MTRKFGLIGFPLTHSFSKKYFTEIFSREGIDAVYDNYPLDTISGIRSVLAVPGIEGINVTIPYKEEVLPFLHQHSEAVVEIGACNCIHIQDGICKGYNTDVIGFEKTLTPGMAAHHSHALVLGTGGAAKAVCYVLQKLNISFSLVSRKSAAGQLTYADLDAGIMNTSTLIINTTPLGMFPDIETYPAIPYQFIGEKHYLYDLVYNPVKTIFLAKGEERGAMIRNGAGMLIIQADESRKIWCI